MHFARTRQVFVSTIGSVIDQTRYLSGAGLSALSYKDGEIQKRSYPNSFGGQYQLKGYELKNVSPASIFKGVSGALDPQRRVIAKPY